MTWLMDGQASTYRYRSDPAIKPDIYAWMMRRRSF